MLERLVLFGATGDLAGRFLFPGLAQLEAAGVLPASLRVVGAAREERDDDGFRRHVARRVEEHAGSVPAAAREALCRRLRSSSSGSGGPISDAMAEGHWRWPATRASPAPARC